MRTRQNMVWRPFIGFIAKRENHDRIQAEICEKRRLNDHLDALREAKSLDASYREIRKGFFFR